MFDWVEDSGGVNGRYVSVQTCLTQTRKVETPRKFKRSAVSDLCGTHLISVLSGKKSVDDVVSVCELCEKQKRADCLVIKVLFVSNSVLYFTFVVVSYIICDICYYV